MYAALTTLLTSSYGIKSKLVFLDYTCQLILGDLNDYAITEYVI